MYTYMYMYLYIYISTNGQPERLNQQGRFVPCCKYLCANTVVIQRSDVLLQTVVLSFSSAPTGNENMSFDNCLLY